MIQKETIKEILLENRTEVERLIILTYELEETVEIDNQVIEVIPVWRWMLK